MKSKVKYPNPPTTAQEADSLAAVLEKKFGFVVIGQFSGAPRPYEIGATVTELWGIWTDEAYKVVEAGSPADWDTQLAFLAEWFQRKPTPSTKGGYFYRLKRVADGTAEKEA